MIFRSRRAIDRVVVAGLHPLPLPILLLRRLHRDHTPRPRHPLLRDVMQEQAQHERHRAPGYQRDEAPPTRIAVRLLDDRQGDRIERGDALDGVEAGREECAEGRTLRGVEGRVR